MHKTFVVNQLNELSKVAEELLNLTNEKKVFIFKGEMGVGKTTFIKELCAQLDVVDVVNSPTFSIVNEYKTREGRTIYHFDFYRLQQESEAFDMGYEEYFYTDNFCFIEWPEKINSLIPKDVLQINMHQNGVQRTIEITE